MRLRAPLPPSLVEHATEFSAGGREPAQPRDAATVVLLRDGADGLELYLLRRRRSMAFAAGMYVFPGGGVDARDAESAVAWVGPPVEEWAHRLGCTPEAARALVCAAVRETFEESGVLLAGPDATSVVADTTDAELEAGRVGLERRELSLSQFLDRHGLVLRTDLLAAWTHWITPEFEPRRYDTRFFVACLPAGQRTRDVSSEADDVTWIQPADALARVDAEEIVMMPPTRVTVEEMGRLEGTESALSAAAGRTIAPVLPRLVVEDDRAYLETVLP